MSRSVIVYCKSMRLFPTFACDPGADVREQVSRHLVSGLSPLVFRAHLLPGTSHFKVTVTVEAVRS